MVKRKREEHEPEITGDEEDGSLKLRKSRLVAQIQQGNLLLHRALKFARGFERQKLGRRQKAAKGSPKDLLRLKEEVIALKQLELAKRAESHLFKQLVRTKRIREAPAFVSIYGGDAESKVQGVKAGAEANVMGRLMNSNPVKEVMPRIMSRICHSLGLEMIPSTTDVKREMRDVCAAGNVETRSEGCVVDNQALNSGRDGLSLAQEGDQSKATTVASGARSTTRFDKIITQRSDSEDIDVDTETTRHRYRLASSSSTSPSPEEAGSEAEYDIKGSRSLNNNGRRQPTGSVSPFASAPLTPSELPSPSPPPSISIPPSESITALPSTRTNLPAHATPFLPSLMLGGYISGSDTDPDSGSPHLQQNRRGSWSGRPVPQPRKNRRGQRARQQIAEKKYGSKARHLHKQQQSQAGERGGRNRDEGWDMRKGATSGDSRNGKSSGRQHDDDHSKRSGVQFGKTRRTGANAEAVAIARPPKSSRKGDGRAADPDLDSKSERGRGRGHAHHSDGRIHPSWEAARKRKLQAQSVTTLFQGKKITF